MGFSSVSKALASVMMPRFQPYRNLISTRKSPLFEINISGTVSD